MLQIHQLSKSYGAATILADVTLLINHNEHVGLIGPNGAGKSTLLRCIVGQERPDAGTITLSPTGSRIGYLPQVPAYAADATIGYVLAAAQTDWHSAAQHLEQAGHRLATAPDLDAALADYAAAQTQFEALGGYEREHRAEAVLEGLGLGGIAHDTPVRQLSGGQKTRLGLATLLVSEPDLLVLDEPTNHLDVQALEWLERFVQTYRGAVLVVSHDRAFLDATATRILYLDPETHSVTSYTGNYSAFAAARQHEHELHVESWKRQQEYVARTEQDIARLKGQALSVELSTTPSQPTVRRIAKKVAKKAKSRERKLERYLEADERVEKPRQTWGLKLDFGPPPDGSRAVLRVEEVAFAYSDGRPKTEDERIMEVRECDPAQDSSLSSFVLRPSSILRNVTFELQYGERVALVGPNGAGKTTLLRLIAGVVQPVSGTIRLGANVRLGIMAQEGETLDLHRTVLEMVQRERSMSETEARNFLHYFLFGGDSVFRAVGACSLGERSRLQLALLVLRGCNLLLLDEPLNHLDIEGREHFAAALDAFEGTIIAVAHDRAFLDAFADRTLEVRDGHVRVVV